LVSPNILEKIVNAANLQPGDIVVEIGTGLGFLSYYLLKKGVILYSFEKDALLLPFLEDFFEGVENCNIIKGDFLRVDLNEVIPGDKKIKVVANLPYSVTSPIFGKLLENERVESMVVTVQRQIAERIVSSEARKTYGAFTLFCNYYADSNLLFHISPGHFHPAPSVYSSVIKLVRHETFFHGDKQELFFDVVKAVFTARRKTIYNNLRKYEKLALDDEKSLKILENAEIPSQERGENLTLERFARLVEEISKEAEK